MWKTLDRNRHYAVNDRGEIKSLRSGKILSPKRNHDGYLRIQLYDHGCRGFVALHRLIAETFLPCQDSCGLVINHKNGVKDDNRVENLEWVTQKDNIHHALQTGLTKHPLNRCGKRVIQCTKDGEAIREFPSTMEAQRCLGIPHSGIAASIKRGGTCGGFLWRVMQT